MKRKTTVLNKCIHESKSPTVSWSNTLVGVKKKREGNSSHLQPQFTLLCQHQSDSLADTKISLKLTVFVWEENRLFSLILLSWGFKVNNSCCCWGWEGKNVNGYSSMNQWGRKSNANSIEKREERKIQLREMWFYVWKWRKSHCLLDTWFPFMCL